MDESLIREQEAQLQKTGRYYKHICFMAVPVLWMACFLYGVRPLLLCGIAVLTGNLCDRLVSLLRRRVYQAGDFSNESFALVIALLMPVTVDIYVLIAAVLAGVLIGKEIFGGYGSYPFNPAAVGYVVAAVSWPEQVFRYPQPYTSIPLWDASMVPVSSTIEDTLRSGGMLNIRSLVLSLGEYAAPMGTGAALVILACGLFLWTQKDAHMSASVSFLLTCALIAFLFPRQAGLADSAVLANVLPRALVYGFSTAVVYLAVYPILNMLFGTGLLSLGIYLPMLTVEPLLTYRFGRVQETVRKAVSKGLRITVGYALLLVLLGCIREWLAAGTVFGVAVSRPVLPMAGMPAGGFIVLGVLCAVWRALAARRRAYLTKEAGNLVDVHSQKEADREG